MANRHSLKGKVALIAGGAKNLGGQPSRALAQEGCKVVVHYNSDSTKNAANETVAAIKSYGGDAFAVQADLTRPFPSLGT